MRRGRLSLPRGGAARSAEEKDRQGENTKLQQHKQPQHQPQHQQRDDEEDVRHNAWPASGAAPISQRQETSATATGLRPPAHPRNPSSPRGAATKKSLSKPSSSLQQPPSQALPRSPWSQLRSRKCANPLSSSPSPSPSPRPSPSVSRRQHERAVIDLTEDYEPCLGRQGDEARTDQPPIPTPTPPPPPTTTTTTTMTTTPRRARPAESKPHIAGATPPSSASLPPPPPMTAAITTTTTAPCSPPLGPPRAATATGLAGCPGMDGLLPAADVEEGRVRPQSTYLRHFEDAVNTAMRVRNDYARLFTSEEREMVQRFARLSHDGKSLYVRLFQRKGPWFRVDGMLGYDEIGSVTPLWVRRRDAAAAATATATSAPMMSGKLTTDVVGCEVRERSAVLPGSPFAPAVEAAPLERALLDHTYVSEGDADDLDSQTQSVPVLGVLEKEAGRQGGGSLDSGQKPVGSSQPTGVTSPWAVAATAAAAAATATRTTVLSASAAAAAGREADENAEAVLGAEVPIAFTPQELTVLHSELQSALCELVEAGFLEGLPDDVRCTGPGLEAALAAVDCCVRLPEMKVLLKRTGAGKTPFRSKNSKSSGRLTSSGGGMKGGSRKGPAATSAGVTAAEAGGRRGMVEELRRRLAGQQTLWGAKLPLVKEVERLVSASVEASGVDIAAATRRGGSGSSSGSSGISDSSDSRGSCGGECPGGTSRTVGQQRCHWLVLVAGRPRLLFKRVLRLMYLTCDTGALSSGRVGAASVNGGGGAGAMSSWSPGLSAAFGKTRYAPYVCNPRARAFHAREDFLRWEAAVELRCALDGAMEDLPRGKLTEAAAVAAAGGAKTEEDYDDENGGDGQPFDRPEHEVVVVLDSDGELEDVISGRKQDAPPHVKHEADKGVEAEASAGEDIRSALNNLEDSIARFFCPAENRGQTDGDASAVADKATSTAEAIALVCSRCLHSHLGTPLSALNPRAPQQPVVSGGVPGTKRRKEETKEEEEADEAFLCLLRQVCGGGSDASGARPGSRGGLPGGVQTETSLADSSADDGGLQREAGRSQPSRAGGLHAGKTTPAPQLAEDGALPRSPSSQPPPGEAESTAAGGSGADGKRSTDHRRASLDGTSLDRDGRSAVPEFLLQLEAGWVLASAVWEGVALLERARDYEKAVELLAQLLATRYTSHRRGRWWNRLSLDLAHTGRLSCALWAAREGLEDPRVRGGDRLALEKRTSMLSKRASNRILKAISREPAPPTPIVRPATAASSSSFSPSSFSSEYHNAAAAVTTAVPDRDRRSDDGDDDNVNAADDEDDVFEDPAVERERRRKHIRRRQKKKRRLQRQPPQQQEQQQQQQQQQGGMVGSSADVEGEDSDGCASSSRISSAKKLGDEPASGPSVRTPTTVDSRDGAGDVQIDEGVSILGEGERLPPAGPASVKASAASATAAAAAASASTVAGTATCEGLVELSQVPDLLNDESIGAVVLAAAVVGGEGGDVGQGEAGVPEMSIAGRRLNKEIGVKSRFVGYGDGAACTVEGLVLQHLSQVEEGSWAGWHCEGSPVRGLWALLMWDVLFMDVPEVFQTPYQDAPLDLDYCPLFYLNRRGPVDARLAEIRAASPCKLVALVGDAWRAHENIVCRGLNWARASVRHLQAIAAGIGGVALAAILAALCLNYKHFGGGLPDLLLMRAVRIRGGGSGSKDATGDGIPDGTVEPVLVETEVSTPQSFVSWLGMDSGAFDVDGSPIGSGDGGERKADIPLPPLEAADMEAFRVESWLLEVKGPTDRLSDRQTAWLRILHRGGARVGVCHVAEGSGGSHAEARGTGAR